MVIVETKSGKTCQVCINETVKKSVLEFCA